MPHGIKGQDHHDALTQSRKQLAQQIYNGMSWSGSERNCLFLNHGRDSFTTASYISGFDFEDDGRGMAMLDWDHDGDIDIWMSNRSGPQVRFLQNQLTHSRWISLKLLGDGKTINRDAVGATVIVWVHDHGQLVPLKRSVTAGDAFLSQSSLWVNVGLGNATIKHIEVRWPDGSRQQLPALKENHHYTLTFGQAQAQVWTRPSPVNLPQNPLEEPTSNRRGIHLVMGTLLPPLHLVDRDKKPVTIATGKAKLIQFWASWCPNCQKDLKRLSQYKSYFQQVGVEIVLVNAEMSPDGNLKMATSPLPDFTNYFMGKKGGEHLQRYLDSITVLHEKVKLPMAMLINDAGEVSAIYLGHADPKDIARTALVAKKSIAWRYINAIPFPGHLFNDSIVGSGDRVALQFHQAGELDYAAKVYQRHIKHYPKSAKIHSHYGMCLLQLKRYPQAIHWLEKSLTLHPEIPLKKETFRYLGMAYMFDLQPQKAYQMLQASLKLGADAKTYFSLGALADQSEQFAKAEMHYQKSIQLSKASSTPFPEPWKALANLYREQGRTLELQHLLDSAKAAGVTW